MKTLAQRGRERRPKKSERESGNRGRGCKVKQKQTMETNVQKNTWKKNHTLGAYGIHVDAAY